MKRLRLKRGGDNKQQATVTSRPANGAPSAKQIGAELAVLFGIIILVVGGFLWWHYIVSNPKRVFNGMLNQAMQTSSGSETIAEAQTGQDLHQTINFQTVGHQVAISTTTLTQPGSTVVSQNVGTPSQDFIRYTSVKTNQTGVDGKPLDFSKVLNIWALNGEAGATTSGQLYNQTVLGAIPFGNLSSAQRKEILVLMQPTYEINYKTIDRAIVKGRPQYTYTVTLKPKEYVTMLQKFAHETGLTQLEGLQPETYADAAPLQFRATIDVWSRQLISINYLSSERVEQFSQFGKQAPAFDVPKTTMTVEELQTKLQGVQ